MCGGRFWGGIISQHIKSLSCIFSADRDHSWTLWRGSGRLICLPSLLKPVYQNCGQVCWPQCISSLQKEPNGDDWLCPFCSLGFRRMNSGLFPSWGTWYPRSNYQLMIAMISLKYSNAVVQPLSQVWLCDPMDCSIQSNVTSLFIFISGIS